ncbi:HAD-IA family hydrolase [Acinetobacter shaoyimingii]|uniref:HAD-IA family hydrolase n=1 Tax=Acinetobacter shaoyimingii TaxID=2715164 RepID=A0A6G8RRK0_9GAMM|nr:HAD-IA family hydrolase [Acinetobacter shaoyimingii]QIO04562.1 HAD-IA family hydrolase [Acinetobacter shaoyimingii]
MKIFICSDFLMTKEKEQFSNLKWVYDLFRRPIEQSTGIEPQKMISSLVNTKYFSRKKFFKLSDIDLNIEHTQFYYNDELINDASLSYLKEFIPQDNLIVGYELSLQTRNLLTRANINYIDIWLHPIRFLDDILFGFSSNNTKIFEKLKKFNFDEKIYELYADKIKIQSYKGFKRSNFEISPNSALFVGQTLEDKAICRDGKMLTVLDFKEKFEAATAYYNKVYYSRHPYVKSGDEEVLKYVKKFKNVEVVDWPVYAMLSSEKLKYVFSVSSSVVHEAKPFGKKTEFLYRPIFNLKNDYAIDNYISIYQEFVSPHFWATILTPLLPTKKVQRVVYLNEKDKLRDMLAFYWSYGTIDKTEMLRKQLNAVDNIVQKFKQKPKSINKSKLALDDKKVSLINKQKIYDEMEKKLKANKVVSFDIFDTLLVRPFAKPDDLFNYMQDDVIKISEKLTNFREIRLNVRKDVPLDKVKGEEVPLFERYKVIGEKYDLNEEQVNKLYNLELDYEFKLIRAREIGVHLFNLALKLKKKVIIISDTFFDKAFILKLLNKNGIKGYSEIYLSSEIGLLKATSNIYPYVIDKLNISASDILHIGDNHVVDIVNSKKHGINSLYLQSTMNVLDKNTLLGREIKNSDNVFNSIVKGLIANKICDNSLIVNNSYVNGSLDNFGYSIFGPILLGFTQWILKEAKNDQIDKLFFLARDGEIIYKASKIVGKFIDINSDMSYLYGSRRGLNVPALKNKDDLVRMLSVNFNPINLNKLMEQRFGVHIENTPLEVIQRCGLTSVNQVVNYKEHRENLIKFIHHISDDILLNAKKERENILKYYKNEGVYNTDKRNAIVDIGHNGTMQKSIMDLRKNSKINGYYFVTYEGISNIISDKIFGKGCWFDAVSPKDKEHPYVKNILMFEMLFLNESGSFVKMDEKNGSFTPIKLSTIGEEKRINAIKEIHKGALNFIEDFMTIYNKNFYDLNIVMDEIVNPYLNFLKSPCYTDVKIFEGVNFENYYSGRNHRSLLESMNNQSPIWPEGAELYEMYKVDDDKSSSLIRNPITSFILKTVSDKGLISDKKIQKLNRDPKSFFEDSSLISIRFVGKKLSKWL